jgi:hypothetical protein
MKKTKNIKIKLLLKNIYKNLKHIEKMYYDESFNFDSILIYNHLFKELFEILLELRLNIYLNSIQNLINNLRTNINQLQYTIRTIIICMIMKDIKNKNDEPLINFKNVFELSNSNYNEKSNSEKYSINNLNKIIIIGKRYNLIESKIEFDSNINLYLLKNKIDYIVDSLISEINSIIKNIIKHINTEKKILIIKNTFLDNKYIKNKNLNNKNILSDKIFNNSKDNSKDKINYNIINYKKFIFLIFIIFIIIYKNINF